MKEGEAKVNEDGASSSFPPFGSREMENSLGTQTETYFRFPVVPFAISSIPLASSGSSPSRIQPMKV